MDGSDVSRTEAVVDTFLASRNEPARANAAVSNRNFRLLSLSVMKRRPVVVVQTYAAVDVRCVSFPACGTLLGPGGDDTSRGWMQCHLGRGSAVRAAVPGTGSRVQGAEAKIPEAGAKSVLLVTEP
jgi:hypothetical protein